MRARALAPAAHAGLLLGRPCSVVALLTQTSPTVRPLQPGIMAQLVRMVDHIGSKVQDADGPVDVCIDHQVRRGPHTGRSRARTAGLGVRFRQCSCNCALL